MSALDTFTCDRCDTAKPEVIAAVRPTCNACLASTAKTYGMCLHCHAVEVALDKVSGYRDLSGMGEAARYPVGYGCEVCS